ncbi:MAG: glycosyltransferase [Planctomycetes bacterium]|nr:glycosyltransferase [Planctomycetota bacterium]
MTELVLVANARMPSQRAQSLQVAQVAASFARAGARTTLLHALRRDTPAVSDADALWDYYAVPPGPRPAVRGVPCVDWIDALPRRLQFVPARVQELSFARNAARVVQREHAGAWVLSRELEAARHLVRRGHRATFLEVHRVPGGATRRRWLLEACAGARGVVAISGGVRDDLVALGVDAAALTVAHDGYEAARFADLPSRAEARRALDLPQDAVVVVYTGGLLAWKGVDLLVEAAAQRPELRVVVAGGMDADVAALRPAAERAGNVRLDGFQPPERVALYLAAADLGVVPNRSTPAISARYTSPLKLFEAMAVGLPLVVSDLPSMRDVLAEDEALFVAPDDAGALAAGLARLAGTRPCARLAERLRARAPEATWDARAARLLAWMAARAG